MGGVKKFTLCGETRIINLTTTVARVRRSVLGTTQQYLKNAVILGVFS